MILWMEGCDRIATNEFDYVDDTFIGAGGVLGISVGNGKFGGDCWHAEQAHIWKIFDKTGSPGNEIFFSAWVRYDSPDDHCYLQFGEVLGHVHTDLRFTTAGDLQARRGDGTVLATALASNLVEGGPYVHLEMHLVVDDSTGLIEVKIDGDTVIDETGIDTRNGSTSGVLTAMRMFGGNASIDGGWIRCDDFVIQDGDGAYLGEHRIRTVAPDGDGATVDFTPQGAGDNYVEVDDDGLDRDTTYNESSVDGDRDELTLPDPGFSGSAKAVKVGVAARMSDPGTTKLKVGIQESGGAEDLSDEQTPYLHDTVYGELWHTSELNPSTSSPWDSDELADALSVYEVG